ncbi:MAG: hypothetical protein ACR2P3_07025 [Geminicoccaceae bacterium]
MTLIGGYRHAVPPTVQQPLPTLAAGQKVQASVLGSTRHGVSVLIGQKTFQLDVPSRLANFGTLTLQGTALSSSSGQKVQIVGLDERPLPQPIAANLTYRPETSSPSASTIVLKSRIEVGAQPISPEGKTVGPSVTLQLHAYPVEGSSKAAGSVSTPVGGGTQATIPVVLPRPPTAAGQQAFGGPSTTRQSGVHAINDRLSGGEVIKPVRSGEGQTQKSGPMPAVAPTSARPPDIELDAIPRAISDVQQQGDLSARPQGMATSKPSIDGEPMPIRAANASVSPIYRIGSGIGSAGPSNVSSQPSPTVEPSSTLDRDNLIVVTVIGRTSTGKVVLKAADQLLRIEQPVDLPLGTMLQATLAVGASTLATAIDPGAFSDSKAPLAKLIELLDNIDRAGRRADELVQARQLPAPDKYLASRFLSLLASEGRQPAQGRLSSSSEQSGVTIAQRDQIKSLLHDLGGMASESLAEGWKSLTLPLGSDQAQAVCFYFREYSFDPDDEASDGDAERKETQRAVFDVSFSQLGRCQIDALCQERRFDLLIRSEERLLHEDQEAIAALFLSACEIAGLNGEIGFKVEDFFEPPRSSIVAKDLQF